VVEVEPFVALFQWFKGGITNICYNCLDRNVEAGLGDKVAFYWEGNELGVDATLTYTQLLHQVCQVCFLWIDKC
jgi:acetyl-CoA synthetase